MAIYRIYSTHDTFIFAKEPTGNAGKDEVLELSNKYTSSTDNTSRMLFKYASQDIQDVINTYAIPVDEYVVELRAFLANASAIPEEFKIETSPVYLDPGKKWTNGVGKFEDIPVNTTGVSWNYINKDAVGWTYDTNLTGSLNITGSNNGGTWIDSINTGSLTTTQEFLLDSNLDIKLDVTEATRLIVNGTLENNGFIVKLEDQLETQTGYNTKLQYFSRDTNSIYPPYFEVKWQDAQYTTGSLNQLETSAVDIKILDNKQVYKVGTKQRFRLHARPKNPTRVFRTTSLYLEQFALPENSHWGIKDELTEDMVVPFSEYTKISCDEKSPYFDLYMQCLQPERFYKILIKTEIDGSEVIVDNRDIIKIIR